MKSTFLALLLVGFVSASDWRVGQLVDVKSERIFTGTSDDPGSVFDGRRAHYFMARSYVIRAGDREYTIAQSPSGGFKRPHVPRVVVNTTIRFQVEKGRVVFLDDDGKEYKGQVEREAVVKTDSH